MTHLSYNITREVPLLGENGNRFVAGVYIEIDDPDPQKGRWMCGMYIHLEWANFWGAEISYIQLSASRSKLNVPFDTLGKFCKIERDGMDYFSYTYSETLTNRLDGTKESFFEDEFDTNAGDSHFVEFDEYLGGNDRMFLQIVPDLRIETWEEFIEYDYTDYVLAMGGMVSLISILFFWGA